MLIIFLFFSLFIIEKAFIHKLLFLLRLLLLLLPLRPRGTTMNLLIVGQWVNVIQGVPHVLVCGTTVDQKPFIIRLFTVIAHFV